MTRDEMKKVQSEPKNPKKKYILNRKALVEECAKALARYPDPMNTWLGSFMAPMDKSEREQARRLALQIQLQESKEEAAKADFEQRRDALHQKQEA